MDKTIIIGAGLCGLTTAYLLKKQNRPFVMLEAQSTIGGRVHTVEGKSGVPIDLGATWFSDMHPQLLQLLSELGLEYFPQHTAGKVIFQTHSFQPPQIFEVPEGEQSSYRLKGGTFALIAKLAQQVGTENIQTNHKIIRISDRGNFLELMDVSGEFYQAQKVITTIPPRVLIDSIVFEPALSESLNSLMPQVQTWMSGAIKFALEYATPFWLQHGFSDTLFSQSSLATELYDHTNAASTKFSLMGFLNGAAVNYSPAQREAMVVDQMTQLFGDIAPTPIAYQEKIWDNEFISTSNAKPLVAHQHNGHALLHKACMNDKLFFAGTETATIHPGYLEGAVSAAKRVVEDAYPV